MSLSVPAKRGLAALAATCALLFACAHAQPAPQPKPPVPGEIIVDMAAFENWRKSFRIRALDSGISEKTFNLALGKVTPNIGILRRDQTQPEVSQAVWEYLDNATSQKRIDLGKQKLADHQATLAVMEKKYGVQARYLVSLWGLESNYGTITGSFNVFEGLATLAYEGRRKEFAETELLAALKIVERGDEPADRLIGSWAGAMGQTQFLPSTYVAYAVDEDGDGRRDLFDSVPDVLGSIANFLAKSGWKTSQNWGEEVRLPKEFEYSLADPTIRLPLARWREMGVTTLAGKLVPQEADQAAIFLPAGHKGPAFLTLDNYRVFLRYNNSTSYALGSGLLADRLGGAPPVQAAWPKEERPLTLSERKELQTLLNQLGFPVGEPDGIVGAGTRAGLRDYQKTAGVPADGFATVSILSRLRADAGRTSNALAPRGIAPMEPIPNP